MLVLNESDTIIIGGRALVCDFSLPDNINEIQIFGDKAIVTYSDGTPNSRINDVSSVPKYDELIQAYYNVRKLQTPSVYHTWNETNREFEITPENQAIKDADIAAAAEAQAIKDEELTANPLTNVTFEQAEAWINTNVTDLASAKEALKRIVKLILART